MKVALFARYSSKLQDDPSLDAQLRPGQEVRGAAGPQAGPTRPRSNQTPSRRVSTGMRYVRHLSLVSRITTAFGVTPSSAGHPDGGRL